MPLVNLEQKGLGQDIHTADDQVIAAQHFLDVPGYFRFGAGFCGVQSRRGSQYEKYSEYANQSLAEDHMIFLELVVKDPGDSKQVLGLPITNSARIDVYKIRAGVIAHTAKF